jgi:hypothetical protein
MFADYRDVSTDTKTDPAPFVQVNGVASSFVP